jgi:hypothetical protein
MADPLTLGALASSFATGAAGAAGSYGVSQLFGSIFGGGSKPAQSSATSSPADYLSLYAGQMAAGNVPLTIAAQGAGVAQGAAAGALGLEAQTQAQNQLNIFEQAKKQADTAVQSQAAEALGLAQAGVETKKQLAQSKLATEVAGVTAASKVGEEALAGQNLLARQIAATNLDIAGAQEKTRLRLTEQRGAIEGQMALRRMGQSMALGGRAAFA